jgi:hypothetical protein
MAPRSVVAILVLTFSLHGSGLIQAADKPKEPLVEQVRKAIERGIQYLRDQEKGRGNWEVNNSTVMVKGGWTALAMLALLNAGVKPDDPVIERGLRYLRDVEPEKTYVVSLQTMVFAEARRNEDRERIQRNVNWLVRAMARDNQGHCLGWTYGDASANNTRLTDNSNTQYALLGLYAGRVAGAHVGREVWESIREYYIRTQQLDHGWVYNPAINNNTKLTMTTAGLCGLLISGMELNAGREIIRANGTAVNCGQYVENGPAVNALNWIGNNLRPFRQGNHWIDLPDNNYYNLYGIERAGRLSGQRFLGRHDWYREGCEYLVGRQQEDGAWSEGTARGAWPVVCTSFALLFLSKGRTPVLISKVVHDPGHDWNNDRNDARNLVEYASKEVFHNVPLAWQVFDARRTEARTADEFSELLGDLLQSPIVYFNGHEEPRFTGVEEELLKQYIEQGGFILAEACCGRQQFDEGFRKLMKKLFPDNPLKKLAPEHPLWRAHAVVRPDAFNLEGIDYGCKTVVIYSPQDLSCRWEANDIKSESGQLTFRIGGNIIAYATGMEPPKPRLTESELIQNDTRSQIPRGYLKVAQLRHGGDWQPAPNAMRNLMNHLHKTAQLDVALETKPLSPGSAEVQDFKFMYMHGRGAFSLSADAVKNLRLDLETGGLLFADACCGKKAFDSAFHALVDQLFPDKKLEPIPLVDELYGKELNGTAITSVRCRTDTPTESGQGGEFRSVAPSLQGVKLGNRWVIIYSKYDIGCALEKHQSTDCLGHDHDSALKLGSAAVLYALRR